MVDYNPNIPQPNDNLSTSQGQLLNNFGQLNTIFAFDHYTWNDATTGSRGFHKKVTFPVPITIAAPTGTSSVFYSKLVSSVPSPYFDTAAGSRCLWYGGSTTGAVSITTGSTPSNGKMIFPNGITLQWGSAAVTDNVAVSFPYTFPNNCFNVTLCGVRDSITQRLLWLKSFTTSNFTVRTDSSGFSVSWIAIGN